jgi:4-diphosphocytidyl-2-C-methyl-D-erythritol kinase
VIAFPPAKINLGLNIVGKRSDGFHEIETCFYPLPLTDVLEIIPSKEFSFSSSGLTIRGSADENLCVKAFKLLQRESNIDAVKIHLHKVIPMGAGLGGGSSDAAYTLRLLNAVFDLRLSQQRLSQFAAEVGSDCSFFIGDGPKLGKGRGEILNVANVSLKGWHLLLVKPEVHVATAEAYAGVIPRSAKDPIEKTLSHDVSEWRDLLVNDFEESIFKKFPVIADVKKKIIDLGAIYSSMTGSGSAVFGLFKSKPETGPDNFPRMFYWCGELN